MSSSGAARALLNTSGTFTATQTFGTGVNPTGAVINGPLTTNEIVSKSVSTAVAYAVLATDEVVLADATAGAFAVTLPAANALPGRRITIKKIDATANAVTVASAGGTIDGAVSIAMATQNEAVTVMSGGANWWIVNQVATTIL